MKLQHFVGVFDNMEAVNIAISSGRDGDYLIVDNDIKGWNPYSGQGGAWETPTVSKEAPVRKTDQIYGDLDVHHDLRVGGKLSANLIRGRNAFLGLFDTENELPAHPCVGEWAMVFAYTSTPANAEEETPTTSEQTEEPATNAETSSENTETRRTENELCVGYIFICKADGVWTNTGYKGGYQSGLFEAIQTVQDNVDEEKAARQAADEAINAKIPQEATAQNQLADKAYVDDSIENSIKALDADVSQEAGTDGLALGVTEVDGKVTGVSGSITMDNTPTQGSNKAVKSGGVKQYVDNAVNVEKGRAQSAEGDINAKIPEEANAENKLADKAYVDDSIENSIKALDADVSQEAGTDGLALNVTEVDGKVTQISGSITMDNAPTQGSNKPVKSGGVKQYVDNAVETEAGLREQADGILQNRINTEKNRAEGVEGELGDAIETINSKIPSAARAGNKLTDKAYVDGAIETEAGLREQADGILQGQIDNINLDRETINTTITTLTNGLNSEIARATAEEGRIEGRVRDIESVIPEQADSSNKLADKNYVDSSIATATATFRGTYNLVSDLRAPVTATHEQIAAAINLKFREWGYVADNNDYVFVQVPNESSKPAEILRVERYKHNGSNWVYEYDLNNSSFTAAQWAALNSGITAGVIDAMQADIAANQAKIAALAAGINVNISFSPSIIYKDVATNVTITGTMVNGTPSSMKLMDGATVIIEGASSPITHTVSVNISTNSKTFKVVGESSGVTLSKEGSVSARYPIYYGFAASASALAADTANRIAPTTSAARTYQKTASVNGQHFYILVPSDISALSNFSMGGTPFVMSASTETINGITYKVYTSGNPYNAGTQVTVVAS